MPTNAEIRAGQIYHALDFPDAGGRRDKSRFVVVIHPREKLGPAADPILVVGISTKTFATDRVELPNRAQYPNCTSGLTEICWAVPEWYVLVARADLHDLRGYVSELKLDEIRRATRRHIEKRTNERKRPK